MDFRASFRVPQIRYHLAIAVSIFRMVFAIAIPPVNALTWYN